MGTHHPEALLPVTKQSFRRSRAQAEPGDEEKVTPLALDTKETPSTRAAAVAFTVETYGINTGGTVYRMDDVRFRRVRPFRRHTPAISTC